MPPRPEFETCAKIDLELLMDHGVFDESRVKEFGLESGEVPMVFLYLRGIRYPKREPSLLVEFEDDEHIMVQRIGMGFADTKKGKKPYMICPASGARCSDLYLHDLRFVSRRSHPELSPKKPPPVHRREVALMRKRDRVLGTVDHPPATGKERTKLIAQLQEIPLLQFRWPELGPHFEEEDQRRQRERKAASRERKTGVNSTYAGLRRGRSLTAEIDLTVHMALSPAQWLAKVPVPGSRFRDVPNAFVEDQPALDIRTLAKHWSLDELGLWAIVVAWPTIGGILVVDFRDPGHPLLVLHELQTHEGKRLPEQVVRLVPSAHNGRWFLQCPVTKRRCEILFWREEMFVSAQPGHLIHHSQRLRGS